MIRPQRRRPSPGQRGYSLAEALVVVAIVGLVTLVTVPNFVSLYRSSQIKSSIRQFMTDVRATKQSAVTNSAPARISMDTGTVGSRTYWISLGVQDPVTNVITWTQVGAARRIEPPVYFQSSTFADLDSDGNPDLVFLPNGTVSNMPSGAQNGTIVLKTDWNVAKDTYTLSINITGRVQLN